MLRSASRLRLLLAGCAAAFALGTGLACDRGATGPREIGPDGRAVGRLVMVVPIGNLVATTLVVEVSAPDIIPTMVFNLPVVAGVATGSLSVPAGAARLFTVRAFDGSTETHRGTKVLTILAGVNPTASITLTPLAGTVPITASLGSLVITITPLVATGRVGDTIRFAATIRDAAAAIVPGPARWATTNTARVTIDTAGLATVLDTGAVIVVATYSTSAGTATFTGSPGLVGPPPAALRTWVGGAGAGAQRTDWAIANNWSPSFVPTAADSVVIGAATFQPSIGADTFTVRDLTLRTGATLSAVYYSLGTLRVLRTASGEGGTFGGYFSQVRLGNGATIRGALPTQITIGAGIGATLADSARIAGLNVDGTGADFALAGKRLVITGPVYVNNGGLLHVSAAAETLDVSGTFQITTTAASHVGSLGAGTVILRGVTNSLEGYTASGTNTVVFAGATAQNVYNMDYVSRPANAMQNVVISGTGGVIIGYYNVRALGSFDVRSGSGGVLAASYYTLRIDGPLTTAAGTPFVSPYLTVDLRHVTGTANVNGTWSPNYTDFNTPNQTIRAGLAYQNVRLYQSQSLADTVRIAGDLRVQGASTVLNITSPRRVIVGSMTLATTATFVLDAASDTLEVHGDLNTNSGGNSLGNLANGTVILWGNLYGGNYSGTGTNLVKFDNPGTTVQHLYSFNPAGTPLTGLQNFEVTGSANVDVGSNVKIGGTLKVLSPVTVNSLCGNCYGLYVAGPITTVLGSTVSPYFVQMGHISGTNRVAGNWSPGYTDVTFPGDTLKPGLAYQSVRFYAADSLQAGGSYTFTGDLTTDGTGVVVGMRGAKLAVQGQLNVQNVSKLLMVDGDTMSVAGNMTWNSSVPSAHTGGQITWGGQYLNMGAYVPGGTHKLKITNTTIQPHINTTDPTLRPFARLEVASPFGLFLDGSIAVADSFVVSAVGTNANVQSYYYQLETRGPVVTAATSTIMPSYFSLNGTTSLAAVAGNFAPGLLRVYQATPGLLRNAPGFHYADIEFHTSYTLTDTLTTTPNAAIYPYTWAGSVSVNDAGTALDLGGKRMRLSGGFDANTNAYLKMVALGGGDTLIVGDGSGAASGYMYLDGGASAPSILTYGTIILRGNANVTNATVGNTHTLVVTDSGLAPGTRTFSLNSGNTLGNVTVRGSSGLTAQYTSNWVVNGSFDVQAGPTFKSGYYYYIWHTNGPISTAASSVVGTGPNGGAFEIGHTSGTSLVNGIWSPSITRWMVPGVAIKPGLAYQNMEFNASGTFSAVTPTTLTGYLYGTGAGTVISLAGKAVNVGDYFTLVTSATLSMTNANDTLMVQNDFQSDNGAVNSNVTAGVIRVRGNVNANRLNPTGTNKIVLDSSGLATAQTLYTYSTPLNRVDLRTNRNVTFSTTMTFSDSLNVLTPVAFGNAYPYYVFTLQGPITSVASSTTSGGTFALAHTTGTSLVNGGWSPFITRWTVAGATIKPTLAYQNMEFNASGTFSAVTPTVLTGYLYGTGAGTVISMAGRSVRAGDYFKLATGATLSMTNALDTLFVAANFDSDNGSVNSNVNNGVIRVRGDVNANRLNPTGASKFVLDSLVSASPQGFYTNVTPFNRVDVRTNRQVNVSNTVTFSDSVNILTPVTFGSTYPYYVTTFVGPVTSVASSTLLGGYLRFQHATAADNLLGNLSTPVEVQLNAPTSSLVPVAPRFSYQYLRIMTTAAMPAAATLKLGPGGASSSGTLYVDGGATLTIPSGSTMNVCSDLNLVTAPTPGTISNFGTLNLRLVPSAAIIARVSPNAPVTGQICP